MNKRFLFEFTRIIVILILLGIAIVLSKSAGWDLVDLVLYW
jgi:hypothetical protein